ncbi:MAG TPA: hypothetical protein GX010_03815 [Erysipelotrichaceae bacterium]|nr:hypothetical protein [Erysipelotrichaceae bacterium]
MKKLLKSLIIILVIFVVIPFALIYGFLYDSSKMKVTYDANFSQEKWAEALVVDSLDDTVEDEKVKFSITEEEINNFIYSAIKDNAEIKKYLTQLALDVRENDYLISASGKLAVFETRAKLSVQLSREIVVSQSGEKEALVMTIKNLTVGRLTKLKEVIMFFVTQLINNQTMDSLTQEFNIHFDLKQSRMFIYMDDLMSLINQTASDEGGMSDFYFAFLNDFISKNLVNIDFYSDESLTVEVNLERLTGNDYGEGDHVYYPMNYEDTLTKLKIEGVDKKLSLEVIKEALLVLMNEGSIDKDQCFDVSEYLFNGHKGDAVSNNAPACSLASIGINNKETYPGFNLIPETSLEDIITNSLTSFENYNVTDDSFDIAQISEADINTVIKAQDILGNKFFLSREVEENQNKLSYIALDNVYINLTATEAFLSVGLNLNGLETIITFTMMIDENNEDPQKLVYNIISVYFGESLYNITVSQETREFLFRILAEAVSDGAFSFSEDGKMTISLDSFINAAINNVDTGNPVYDAMYRNFLQNNADFSISVVGTDAAANSTVKVTATRRI